MSITTKRPARRYYITISRKITQILSFIIVFGGALGYAATVLVLPIRVGLSNPFVIVADAWMLMEIMFGMAMVPLVAIASIALFTLILGRATCGWICPFGLINDILGALGKKKKLSPQTTLGLWKFALSIAGLLLFIDVSIYYNEVVGSSIKNYFGAFGDAPTTFIDPVTTLFSLLFWMTYSNKWPKDITGWFNLPAELYWRLFFLAIVIIGMLLIPRFYCKALCPLGAIMGLGSEFALLSIHISKGKCIECKACERACPMDIPILSFIDKGEVRHPQCIMCLKCMEVCPAKAIWLKFG